MIATIAFLALVMPAAKHSYSYEGVFMEGCSCHDVCISEITGKDAGCHGLGAIDFKKGSFDGSDFSGAKVVFVWDSGKWVRLYIDAPAPKKKAVTDFMMTMVGDWGAYEGATDAKILINSNSKEMSFSVNDGKIAKMSLKPVLGGDGKTGVAYDNLKSPMHSKLWQGETISAGFSSGREAIALLGTNGYYNVDCKMHGQI